MSIERRRSPRLEILGRLHGRTAASDVAVTVRDINLGGMSVETSVALDPGSVHELLLTLGDGSSVHLSGEVVHTRSGAAAPDGSARFISGIRFRDEDPDVADTAGDVIDRIK